MASTDALPLPRKNVAYRVTFPILDADGDLVTGATGLDSEVSKDGGTFTDCTNEATEIATSSGIYYLDLSSTEMNADTVAVIVKTSSSGAKTTVLIFYPQETGDIKADVDSWAGTAVPTTEAGGPGVIRRGTAQGGASSAITLDASASSVDHFYAGDNSACFVEIIGGTGVGQGRIGISYNGTSKSLGVDRPWITTPDSTSVFRLFAGSTPGTDEELAAAWFAREDTEVTSVPAADANWAEKWGWIFALSRNQINQTNTEQTVRNDGDSADIGSASVSDNGTTFTRGQFS
jgi:hypothetical protein